MATTSDSHRDTEIEAKIREFAIEKLGDDTRTYFNSKMLADALDKNTSSICREIGRVEFPEGYELSRWSNPPSIRWELRRTNGN